MAAPMRCSVTCPPRRVPAAHPLRAIRMLGDDMPRDMFPLGRLLRTQLLQAFLLGSLRAPADGATGLHPAVLLVCPLGHGRIDSKRRPCSARIAIASELRTRPELLRRVLTLWPG